MRKEGRTGKGSSRRNLDTERDLEELPTILTYEELDRLMCTVDDIEDLVFVCVGVFGGLRAAEILGLRPCDVHVDPPSVTVSAKTAKGGRERISPVTPLTVALLHHLSTGKGGEDLLFSRKYDAFYKRMVKLGIRASIDKNVTPHIFRHTCATMQLDMGVDLETIKSNLGHKDIKTTQLYLALNIRSRARKYMDALRMVL